MIDLVDTVDRVDMFVDMIVFFSPQKPNDGGFIPQETAMAELRVDGWKKDEKRGCPFFSDLCAGLEFPSFRGRNGMKWNCPINLATESLKQKMELNPIFGNGKSY